MTEHIQIPGLRLGRRPPSDKPTLKASTFLRAATLPTVPDGVDHLAGVEYGMYSNDKWGTCGPTSLANYVRMVTATFGTPRVPTWEDVKALYRLQNPGFDETKPGGGQDEGVDMKTMLADAVKHGFGDTKVLGFAAVNVDDPEEVEAAVAIFGGVLLGLDLKQAQSEQLAQGVWDYVPDSPEWGGHAVMEGAYEADDDEDVITWAQRCTMTRRFVVKQRSEAYVVILADHLGSKQFLQGFDLGKFADAYQAITGRAFPADVPGTPPVDPPVVPPLPGALEAALQSLAGDVEVVRWAGQQRHRGVTRRAAEGLRAVVDAFQSDNGV